jgi:hypothetical protein
VHAGGGGTLGVLLMINGLRIHYCMFERILPLACTHHPLTRNLDSQNTHPPKKKTLLKQKEKTDNPDQDNEQQSLHGSTWVCGKRERETERDREDGLDLHQRMMEHMDCMCVCV